MRSAPRPTRVGRPDPAAPLEADRGREPRAPPVRSETPAPWAKTAAKVLGAAREGAAPQELAPPGRAVPREPAAPRATPRAARGGWRERVHRRVPVAGWRAPVAGRRAPVAGRRAPVAARRAPVAPWLVAR